jgi:flagella basal body P-ring formation protein FlgA
MLRDIVINLVFLVYAATAVAGTPALTGKTTIEGESVTVGDIFTHTGEHTDFVLAPAPTASKPLILTKADLKRIAAYFKLNWQAPDTMTTVILKAPANQLDENSILVPTLVTGVTNGAIITPEMVIEVAIPRDQIQATTVLRKEDMIGQMAKRTLMANIPVNQKDIMPPTLVKRNELITVVYRNGMVNLTTRARATENASKGQVITLINLTSKKPFQAVVSGLQQAEIIIEQNS